MKAWVRFVCLCAALLLFLFLPMTETLKALSPASASGAESSSAAGYRRVKLDHYPLGVSHSVRSVGRYSNWSGVSTVSQFEDENGNLCLAIDREEDVLIYRVSDGEIAETVSIGKTDPDLTLGTALCDSDGFLYLVFGKTNSSEDASVNTIFVNKYTREGAPVASAGGNGSEGMPYYYPEDFRTKIPFSSGNCDAAICGDLLCVNYARKMYNGHQSNTLFTVRKSTMETVTGITDYNSHSFDQRITPYEKTGGFLIESHGDCYPRAFSTTLTSGTRVIVDENRTFDFWVEPGTLDDYDMYRLNRTRARLGNILETDTGAALVASSARSLSEDCKTDPWDVFVQIFNPAASPLTADSFVTEGTREGLAGSNGDVETVNYGVLWLTDNRETGLCADVVQAVSLGPDRFAVLYELYEREISGEFWYFTYDSTWYMVVDSRGNIVRNAEQLENVRLNKDEDPVAIGETVQWVANGDESDELIQYVLRFDNRELTSVTVDALPEKTAYYVGDAFEDTGLRLKLTLSDGSTETASSGFTVVVPDMSAPGEKTVTVCFEDKAATFTVTVKEPSVRLSQTDAEITEMETLTALTAETDPPSRAVAWSSDHPDVASVGETTGHVTGNSPGTAVITASVTYNGIVYRASCTVKVNPHVHAFGEWTEDPQNPDRHIRSCACGFTESEDHIWDEGTVLKEATHLTEGVRLFVCTVCGKEKKVPIPADEAHGPYLTYVPKTEPGCETPGKQAYYVCPCGKCFTDAEGTDEIADLSVWGVIDPLQHEYHSFYTEPSGGNAGYTTYVCGRCGHSYIEKLFRSGDVNFDGTVNARDYMILKRAVLLTYSLTGDQREAGDVLTDGIVNARDYMLLKRVVLGTYHLEDA
ncbi:MAG: bacterial Ig-like domain-containing protein [Clostridia bacterium]|nr:bacterial Ig-like domain-containing protein [Clostridia bacterium]